MSAENFCGGRAVIARICRSIVARCARVSFRRCGHGSCWCGVGRRAALTVAVLGLPFSAMAAQCPEEDGKVLFHSCHGEARAELILLPEGKAALARSAPGRTLVVSGAYTGADQREGGLPNPVGLFVDMGRVINPNLARMDGILVIGKDGQPRLYHATSVPFRGETADLTEAAQRLDFAAHAAQDGVSVMQSHLLIFNGQVDFGPQDDAPTARRRMFFSGPEGWGVYQTAGAMTLYEAAMELKERFQPDMALNLDMGSYDYCLSMHDAATTLCGVLGAGDIAKLSNALRLTHPAR